MGHAGFWSWKCRGLGFDISARTKDALGLHWLGNGYQVPRDSGFVLENKVAQKEGGLKIIILKRK